MSPVPATRGKRWQTRLILLALVILFVGPIVAAWVLYTHPALWRPGKTTNYGELITPPRPIEIGALRRPDGTSLGPDFFHGKWTLLYIGGPACGSRCRDTLYALRQIQLAQGKDIEQVQRLYVMTDTKFEDRLISLLLKQYPRLTVAISTGAALDKFLAPFGRRGEADITRRVYLIDPRGNLMMRYRRDADPKGVLRDLRHLLKISHGFM